MVWGIVALVEVESADCSDVNVGSGGLGGGWDVGGGVVMQVRAHVIRR